MSETENKYRNWVFTWNRKDRMDFEMNPYMIKVISIEIETMLKSLGAESYVFQLEAGEVTHRPHFQGCFRMPYRVRQTTILQKLRKAWERSMLYDEVNLISMFDFSCLTVDRMFDEFKQSVKYCTKEETRYSIWNGQHTVTPVMSADLKTYQGEDLEQISDKNNLYEWQKKLFKKIFESDSTTFKIASDREIIWITDRYGCSGKSKLTKYMCHNFNNVVKLPFGTASQMRSAVVSAGIKEMYIVDIPKTLGEEDSMHAIISVLEDIKNGHVTSAFYGQLKTIMFNPPIVIVFSNKRCPKELMSLDRWTEYVISSSDKDWENGLYVAND